MSLRLSLALLGLPGCIFVNLGPEHVITETFTVDVPVSGVQFDLPAGDVSFQLADVPAVEVTWTLRYRGDPPDTVAQVSADTLFIDADCAELTRSCSVDLDVVVPAGVWAAGTTGAGDIDLVGLTAGVEVDSGAGDITMRDILGFVGASTGAGDIDGRRLDSGEVWADSGAGDIELEAIGPVTWMSADSGSGDLTLVVPSGVYAVDASTGAGKLDIDGITIDDDAGAVLRAQTGAGDVTIHGY